MMKTIGLLTTSLLLTVSVAIYAKNFQSENQHLQDSRLVQESSLVSNSLGRSLHLIIPE